MATAVQKEIIKTVAAEENLGGWTFDMIESLIDAGTLKVERKRDFRAWTHEQRALGRTHLFNGEVVNT